ncbi:MAG: CHAT domain-containing protein [Pyrinomonadaceae bacterium]
MKRAELAKRLISLADTRTRRNLIVQNLRIADEKLADEIRELCYANWTSAPVEARRAAATLNVLAKINDRPVIRAAAFWVDGIAKITNAKFEQAVLSLNRAVETFANIGKKKDAAQAQVAQLLALAMLGRYDEAIRTGHAALKILAGVGDHLAAGKIEMNLSNIVSRRSQHSEAVRYCASARRRFIKAREKSWQAMAENGLANSYMELNQFVKAERYYKTALETARTQKMPVTEAEIEASLGNLALMRGLYPLALRSLEISRQQYAELEMPHQSAIAELEIADIYAELNLTAEATEIYTNVAAAFSKLKLRAEEARARLNLGRLLVRTRDLMGAKRSLTKAHNLFEREKNLSAAAVSLLSLAAAELALADHTAARQLLNSVSGRIAVDENPRSAVRLELLNGIEKLASGNVAKSKEHLILAIRLAKKNNHPEAIRLGETWLGRAFLKSGDLSEAARHFRKAIEIVELQRDQLGSDEFHMSYSATRLDAHGDLGKMFLSQNRVNKAFEVFEMGRSRSLLVGKADRDNRDRRTNKLIAQAVDRRAELNLLYRRADVSPPSELRRIREQITKSEKSLANLDRQINSLASTKCGKRLGRDDFTLTALQSDLGASTSLVEYVVLDGKISAFVVTAAGIDYLPSLATESEVGELLEHLHFQLDTVRYGSAHLHRFAPQLKAKTDYILAELHEKVFAPLEKHVRGDRLLVVPAGPVNYVPFSALFNGEEYLVERFEIRHAPSAAIWQQLAKQRRRKMQTSLLVGFADERIPLVENEIKLISKVLPDAKRLNGKAATFAAFSAHAGNYDLLHIACHGQFRPDNPMFSSLHLADGWVTVRDLVANEIGAELVTLSACETGISKIFAGEEILGLARGFLSAGARSLIVSLWAVNDTAATKMMPQFYKQISAGDTTAAALRNIQLEMIARETHPSLWAPFFYIGP